MSRAPRNENFALCVATVQDGRVLSERWFAAGEPVRVGRWPRNHIPLSAPTAPGRMVLFDGRRDGHVLCVDEQLRGRLALEDGNPSVQELCPAGGDGRYALPPGARGRLHLHGVTLLFKVVPEPLAASYLSRSWRASLMEDEPVFHTFLTGFSAIAALIMTGLYNIEPVELTLDGAPPQVYASVFELNPPTLTQPLPPTDAGRPNRAERREQRREERRAAAEAEPQGTRDLATEARARSALLRILDSRGEHAVEGVLSGNDELLERTRASLEGVGAVEVAGLTPGVRDGQGLRPTEGTASLESACAGDCATTISAGPAAAAPRTGRLTFETVSGPDEISEPVSAALRHYASTVRTCYERTLNIDPSASGRLVLVLNVTEGRVTAAEVVERDVGDEELGRCVERSARAWRLPETADGEIELPYLLQPG